MEKSAAEPQDKTSEKAVLRQESGKLVASRHESAKRVTRGHNPQIMLDSNRPVLGSPRQVGP
eukprot:12918226-Prorocentrum_lima.AAC.1